MWPGAATMWLSCARLGCRLQGSSQAPGIESGGKRAACGGGAKGGPSGRDHGGAILRMVFAVAYQTAPEANLMSSI
jgi:hypothetical protein